jgi:ABC-type lipoprotein release transport system permease subunit
VVGRLVQSLLVQTHGNDPALLASTAGLLIATAVIACSWPAVRARRLGPLAALRSE